MQLPSFLSFFLPFRPTYIPFLTYTRHYSSQLIDEKKNNEMLFGVNVKQHN